MSINDTSLINYSSFIIFYYYITMLKADPSINSIRLATLRLSKEVLCQNH